MILPDVFSYFIPYFPFIQIFDQFLVVTTEELNPSFVDTITSNIGLLAGFITSVTIVAGVVISVGVWLKRTVTKENKEIRKETADNIEKVKNETSTQIKENKLHIDTVKTVLETKIDTVSSTMSSMKQTLDHVDKKLDQNVSNFHVNKTRLDGHDNKINRLEDRVYDTTTTTTSKTRHTYRNDDEDEENRDIAK